jgi:hypothetical protein
MGKGGILGQLATLLVINTVRDSANDRAQAAGQQESERPLTAQERKEGRSQIAKALAAVATLCALYAVYQAVAVPAVV